MAVVSTGFFDGVHLGHRLVLRTLVGEAERRGEESIVVTFWPHPRNVLQNGARNLRLLTSLEEKKALLKAQGVSRVEVLTFSKEFAAMTAEAYVRDVLVGRFGASALVVGYDNRLGSDQLTGDALVSLCGRLGLAALTPPSLSAPSALASPAAVPGILPETAASRPLPTSVPPLQEQAPSGDGCPAVSSTAIRAALSEGHVEEAWAMLGYGYTLHGVVVEGNRLGRTIGFPTANMQMYEPLKLVPADGVYAVSVETLGRHFLGMCNIGIRPTVGNGSSRTVETNIFDFDEDIYGLDIRITFLRRIRSERRFDSLSSLADQLSLDRAECLRSAEG